MRKQDAIYLSAPEPKRQVVDLLHAVGYEGTSRLLNKAVLFALVKTNTWEKWQGHF